MSLSARILTGLGLGLGVGIFLGELVSPLGIAGRAFILLLQMTVLPYVAISLIASLGSLRYQEAKLLARNAGGFLLLLWVITLSVVLLTPLAFPNWESASFFSSSLVEEQVPFDLLTLFIPSNPFYSLSENLVPGVVVFSAALGVALIGVERKEGIVGGLRTLTEAMGRITNAVMQIAPIGVFAIAANAGGTLDLDVLQGLQVYVAVTVASTLVLTFWTLPALVATLSPLRYAEVFRATRIVLVTAFATGNLFVVLSLLAERCKDLVSESEGTSDKAKNLVEVVVPAAYNLPTAGKLLGLGFVLFAGWFTGNAVSASELAEFISSGLVTFFGSTLVAIPFLLDLFRIPADTLELFIIADNVIVGRFGAMLSAMFLITLTLLSALAAQGKIVLRLPRLLGYAGVTAGLTFATVLGVRFSFEALGREYRGYQVFVERDLLLPGVKARLVESVPEPLPHTDSGLDTIDRIRARGLLRVGYQRDRLPYAYRNANGELVGFDVEMMHRLALDLGVGLELVQVDVDQLPALLASGYLDLGLSLPITPTGLEDMSFPRAHFDETLAFVVPDYLRQEFSSGASVRAMEELDIGVPDLSYYAEKLRNYLPQARLHVLDSPRSFFQGTAGELDAMVYGAAAGSAWCLVYPDFSVAVPHPDVLAVPMAFPVARGDQEMVYFISQWLTLKEKDRTIERLFDYWIQGRQETQSEPRWSVIRNVLGWVD